MAGGNSRKGVARLNEVADKCKCCEQFLVAFRLTAGPDDYRLGSAGWNFRHHSFRFLVKEGFPAWLHRSGDGRDIRAPGRRQITPESTACDQDKRILGVVCLSGHATDSPPYTVNPRIPSSVTVRCLTLS